VERNGKHKEAVPNKKKNSLSLFFLSPFLSSKDDVEFGRRVVLERELDSAKFPINVAFDESGNFLVYSSFVGIKSELSLFFFSSLSLSHSFSHNSLLFSPVVVNIVTNALLRVLGKDEAIRFTSLALFQGKSKGSVATDNLQHNPKPDPTVFVAGFRKNRFYLFSQREPEDAKAATR
jgi:peptidylprolyl isomerase domain and WD repeat-containing protein 1